MTMELKVGTRGSRLALAQTELVLTSLAAATSDVVCVQQIIETTGDWKPQHGETRLAESAGGKGLFIKEIEQAIAACVIDIGVHSLKDVPSFLPDGMMVDHVMPRADARDILIVRGQGNLMTLPAGATIGTSSLRRQAMLMRLRPDLKVVPLRGNVTTRLDKLRQGQVDAIILANAGLSRLGAAVWPLAGLSSTLLDADEFLPACGQGIIGIEVAVKNTAAIDILNKIHHAPTGLCAAAERRVLQILDGSCQTPIGAYAVIDQGVMHLRGMIAQPDGLAAVHGERRGSVATRADVEIMANDLGVELRKNAPRGLLPDRQVGT
jgi:hydroxymethylbilane synthase